MSTQTTSPLILPQGRYQTIVIDPPWPGPGEHRSGKAGGKVILPYQTMTGIQLASMRIQDIAAPGGQLWLWATARNLGDATLLLQLWGFSYAGLFVWQKPANLGPWIRHDCEFLLRGVLPGAEIKLPAPVQTHQWPEEEDGALPIKAHRWKRPKAHSEKPPEAYQMISEYSPGPRLDIFARQARPGFEPWGNQSPA